MQRDIGNGSAAGFLITSDHTGRGGNDVFAADLRLKLNPNWIFAGQATRSVASGGPAISQAGSALLAEIRHKGKHGARVFAPTWDLFRESISARSRIR